MIQEGSLLIQSLQSLQDYRAYLVLPSTHFYLGSLTANRSMTFKAPFKVLVQHHMLSNAQVNL